MDVDVSEGHLFVLNYNVTNTLEINVNINLLILLHINWFFKDSRAECVGVSDNLNIYFDINLIKSLTGSRGVKISNVTGVEIDIKHQCNLKSRIF